MTLVKEYFPEIMIHMQEEILSNHPRLVERLSQIADKPLEEKVAFIAFYCNYGVDGYFKEHELEALMELLYKKLKEMSSQKIITVQ